MASNELLQGLIETNLAGSAAILLVLALRRPLRRAFGAGVAYAAWALVPLAMLAVLLPAASAPMAVAMPALAMLAPVDAVAGVSVGRAMPDPWAWAALAWALGALACAAWMAAQQRRFLCGLGGLADRGDGVLVADAAVAGLPAVVGLWRPRIVLPADVQQRYDATERALMLAHERTHVAHGDLFANALAAGLRCLCWCNPLVHAAARRFRDDQELACDQQVVRRHPGARRAYGEAMLKTQLAGGLLPLGCHWGQTHPIRERIEMLKQPLPTRRRRVLGSAIAAMLSLSVGYAAWAAQPQDAATKPADAGPHALQQAEVNAESRALNPPVYPAEALKEGVVGTTVLVVDVDAEGGVSGLKIDRSSGDPRLDSAALEAASRWKFKPGIKGGKPIAGQVRVPVQFAMHEPSQPEADAGERPAQIIAAQPPKYPKAAAENRVEGRVMLIVDIAADGSVTGATVDRSAGDASLDAAALEAVRQWRFQPALKDGKAVAGKVRVPIDFAMDEPEEAAGDGAGGSDYYVRPAGA